MANQPQATRRFRLRDIVEDRRIVLMLALGFSSGLPLLLVLGTFTLRLAFSDIDVRAIGLFSYVALPYSLKFLWAPAIDRLNVPVLSARLGRRRAWMVTTQAAVALCLILMAFSDPKTNLALLGLGAFLVAFCAASQDVVIDGWRIDAAGSDFQGILAATSNLGYRIGLITAGAGALFIASAGGWTLAYLIMAALMLVGMIAALL
ncbi:MFS transporter, partial [Methylobacterium radiotolerans]